MCSPKNKEKDRNFIKEKIEQLRNKTKFSKNPHENLKIKKLVSKREKEIDRKVQVCGNTNIIAPNFKNLQQLNFHS